MVSRVRDHVFSRMGQNMCSVGSEIVFSRVGQIMCSAGWVRSCVQ